jgi:MYXO-CTERM domain-containing protein
VGDRDVSIFFGPLRCETTGAVIPICRTLPADLAPATHAVCGNGSAHTVTLAVPSLTQNCISNPTITGRLITSNGVPVVPPRAVAANGNISLAPGTHVIEWRVSNAAGVSQTSRQTIFVLPAFAASGSFWLRDRARLSAGGSQFAALSNGGGSGGISEVGADAHAGDIISVPNVFVRSRGTVHGFVRTSGTLTRQTPSTITGSIQTGVPLSLGGVANPPVIFPSPAGPDVILEPDQVGSRAPGSYGRVAVKSRARLTFQAGDYLMEVLELEPDAKLIVAPGTRLFVKSSMIYRGLFTNAAGQLSSTFLAYYGTAALFMESNFSGTLLAANATVVLGDGDSRSYSGKVLAKDIEVRPDVTLTCSAGVGPIFPAVGQVVLAATADGGDARAADGCACRVGDGDGDRGRLWWAWAPIAALWFVRRRARRRSRR